MMILMPLMIEDLRSHSDEHLNVTIEGSSAAFRLELPTGSFPRVSSLTAQGSELQFQFVPGAPACSSTLQILDLPPFIIAFANSLTSLSVYGHILVVLFLWRVLDNKGLVL